MIRYEGFAKAYGAVRAVRDLTLRVEPGEALALIGPNGSGKTTCLKAALGLVRPGAGTVRVDGRDPFRDPAARAAVGYLPQRLGFDEGATALEILRFHAALRGVAWSRVDAVLDRFGLTDAAARPADTFSGGMRQRLGLAIAMIGDPPLLVLDEPSAALDPSAALAVRDALRALRAGTHRKESDVRPRTLLFASHNLAEVSALADRVGVFVDGELRALGAPGDLAAGFGLPSRIRVDAETDASPLAEAATRAGAQRVAIADGVLCCDVAPDATAQVIEAMRAAGSALANLSVREPGVEDVYRAVTMPTPRLVA